MKKAIWALLTVSVVSLFLEAWSLMLLIGVLSHSGLLPATLGYGTSLLVMWLLRLSGLTSSGRPS